jgi:hypothetical protein
MVNTAIERDLTETGFFSEKDFGSYLAYQREKKGMTLADVVNSVPNRNITEEKLRALEQGSHFVFDQTLFVALAQLYELDIRLFVLAALPLYQRLERERIEQEINKQIQAKQGGKHGDD